MSEEHHGAGYIYIYLYIVGIGSRGHVDFEDLLMMDMTSEDLVGLKESNFEEDGTSSEFSGGL